MRAAVWDQAKAEAKVEAEAEAKAEGEATLARAAVATAEANARVEAMVVAYDAARREMDEERAELRRAHEDGRRTLAEATAADLAQLEEVT